MRDLAKTILVAMLIIGACGVGVLSMRDPAPPKSEAPSPTAATFVPQEIPSAPRHEDAPPRKRPVRKRESAQAQPPALQVSAEELGGEYQRNEVAADARFKNRLVEATGTVETISKDFMNDAYLVLTSAGLGVHCDLGSHLQPEVARLSPGDQVVVRGRCQGMILASPILRHCSLVRVSLR